MSSLHPKILLPCTLALICATAVIAQQEQPPRFRTEVKAVLVDVLVLDGQGQPVSGLTRDDFEVYEDGVPQTISNFDIIDWTSYVAAAAPPPEAPEPLEEEPAPRPESVETFPRRFIFILNRQGAEFSFMIRAKEALERFVVESMARGDEAMVIDIGQSTRIVQQFSSSKEQVLQAVKKITPMRANVYFGTRMATENVYDALGSLGDSLRAILGRKVLIFMSPELSKTRDLRPVLRDTVASLNTSNTTIYAVNIQGVESIASIDEDRMEAVTEPEETSIVADTSAPVSTLDSIDIGGLFPLAYETGGRYFVNMNDFEPAVQRIGEENQRYYLLTYMPTNRVFDNRYRRIEVKVNRPDVTVKARKGYYPRKAEESVVTDSDQKPPESRAILQPSSKVPSETSTPPPSAAPSAPRPPTQIEITNYLFPTRDGKVEVPIAVALPLELVSDEKGQPGSRSLEMTLTDGSGSTLASFSDSVDPKNFSVVRTAVVPPGNYLLQITLTSAGETIYQTSTQIDVPVGYGERFGLSSIIPFLASNAQAPGGEAPAIRPTSTVRVGEDVFLNFRVFPGKRGEPSESAQMVCSIYQGDHEVQSLRQPDPLDLKNAQDGGLPVVTRLPTGKLAPGTYRIVVWVSDPRLGRRATGELELTVVQ